MFKWWGNTSKTYTNDGPKIGFHGTGNSNIPKRPFFTDEEISKTLKRMQEEYKFRKENQMEESLISKELKRNRFLELNNLELLKNLKNAQQSETYWAKAFSDLQTKYHNLEAANSVRLKEYSKFVCEDAVEYFGHTIQSFVAAEEMGELIQALSKDMRGQGDRKNILEEIVDVSIMLEQLKSIYKIDHKAFSQIMFLKLSKLQNKLTELKGI